MNILRNLLLLTILVVCGWFVLHFVQNKSSGTTESTAPVASVTYSCDAGKTVDAVYYEGKTIPAATPDTPPTPGGSVKLSLSDMRSFTLHQTISASGVRYATADESFVFWNKGNTASVAEAGKTPYTCIEVSPDPGGLTQVYESGARGFTIRYPETFSMNEAYAYQAFGPGKDISGVKFGISPALAEGTNLSSDSYLSVEQIPGQSNCNADLFLYAPAASSTEVTEDGTTYSVATTSDAAVGNRYEETVYTIPGTNPCIAIRYFVHYAAIENFPDGSVKAFDKATLISQFDAIRKTLVIGR